MVELFGRERSRTEINERTGALQQVAGVELLEYADGPERGVRVLDFRTGSGLSFRVAVDRGFDLLAADYRGVPIGWRSPAGPRHPGLASVEENRGWGFLRSFTGLLATCGLDHALAPATSSVAQYIYPGFTEADYPLHGRVAQIPARLLGYGERWQGDRCTLWAEAEVAQMAVFGENLVLTRRMEAELGGVSLSVDDRVENRGFRPTSHMLLYHYNFGYPLLDEGAELLVPSRAIVHAVHKDLHAQGVGHRLQGAPKADFSEQVYEHDVVAGADGMTAAALVNLALGDGFGIRLDYDRAALPCLIEWQCLQSGLYVLGIEPSTNHVLGRKFAESRGELMFLDHGETRSYRTRLSVLDGAAAIAAARREIEALHPPLANFTEPTGELPILRDGPCARRWLGCVLVLAAGVLLAGATACEKGPDGTEVARSVEEPPPVRGTLVVTAYGADGEQAGPTVHTTTWVQGKDGYAGMEENDLRGNLDGTFRYGWNQPGQGHVRVGRREMSPAYGEHELFRVLARWEGIALPRGAEVEDAVLTMHVEAGPPRAVRLFLYEVNKDWDPGRGGILQDNLSPPKPGEVWWNDIAFGRVPWGRPGVGLASDTDPEADTPVSPLAEAAYEPGAPALVFQSPALAAYVERAAGQGAPLRFLLKASDYLEDVPIGPVELYSGNHGDSRNRARRPSLTVRWRAAAEGAGWRAPVLLEHGRRLAIPRLAAAGATSVAVTFEPEGGAHAPCEPTIEWRGSTVGGAEPWTRRGIGSGGPWDWIDVRLTAACDPVPLGDPFEAELRDTWIRTAAPEEQEVPWAFVSPMGVVHRVAARYEGDYRWSVRFVPDEAGRWRYTWKQRFTEDPYTSAPGVFDVVVPAERVEAATEGLLRDLKAWQRREDPVLRTVFAARLARLERAAVDAIPGEKFRNGGGAEVRRRLNAVRAALDAPAPDPIPLEPGRPPAWQQGAATR